MGEGRAPVLLPQVRVRVPLKDDQIRVGLAGRLDKGKAEEMLPAEGEGNFIQ